MKDFINAKKTYLIALAIFFVFVSLSETTYSLFLKSDTTDDFGYNTGLLDLVFVEDEAIKLENAFPIIDSEGVKLKPYVLTLKNTGSLPYLYDLKMLGSDGSIDERFIKVKVNDGMAHTLYSTSNVIVNNNIIYPNEEVTFKINVWLDSNTPNTELGKTFNAKIVTTGSSTYKTLDNSGANYPIMANGMIPVYYSNSDNKWYIADKNNIDSNYVWYKYNDKIWANTVTLRESDKYIYDITRGHDIKIQDVSYDNGNYVVNDKYFNIDLGSVMYSGISNIYRMKINTLDTVNYIMATDNYSYYYDNTSKRFVFNNGTNQVVSNEYTINENTWYIVGYTYDGNRIRFYVNGNNIGTVDTSINLSKFNSFKLGTDASLKKLSKITFGDVLVYNRVLSDNEISGNYKSSINIIRDGLVAGYDNFIPMNFLEHYHNMNMGSPIKDSDIANFYVWIPRFKYMVWNVMGEESVSSYNAYENGVNIAFENGNTSSGVINCDNTGCFSDINKTNLVNNLDNGKYYTHPAFTKTTGEVNGLWVSKYEISNDNGSVISKPNLNIWVNSSLSEYYKAVSRLGENYHVIKNTEWGAISYLTHSRYGLCVNNHCDKMVSNDKYISGNNQLDSTTGNMYGVFDMAGSAWEYTMSSFSEDSMSISDIPISSDDYDSYTDAYILGDATKELKLANGIWDNNNVAGTSGNWIIRGGTGLYSYNRVDNSAYDYVSTRIIYK